MITNLQSLVLNRSAEAEAECYWQTVKRAALLVVGLILGAIGFVGVFLPGIPTTGPVLGAAYCFTKSSPRLEKWLRRHRWFQHCFTFAERCKQNPVRTRFVALLSMWTSVTVSCFVLSATLANAQYAIAATLGGTAVGTWFICKGTSTRRSANRPNRALLEHTASTELT